MNTPRIKVAIRRIWCKSNARPHASLHVNKVSMKAHPYTVNAHVVLFHRVDAGPHSTPRPPIHADMT